MKRSPSTAQVIMFISASALALVAIVWAVTFERLRYEQDAILAEAMKDSANLAIGLEQDVTRTLRAADQAIAYVRSRYLRDGRALDISTSLEAEAFDASVLAGIRVANAAGDVVVGKTDDANLRTFDFFLEHVWGRDDRLFVGRPAFDANSGRWSLDVSRRITGADGSFQGVVSATMDPATLADFFKRANLDAHSLVIVVSLDGVGVVRRVGSTNTHGESYKGRTLLERQATNPVGGFLSVGALDATPRYISYRTLERYPLVVALGISRADVLASLDEHRRSYFAFALLATVLIGALAAGLLLTIARQRRAHKSLKEVAARLRASESQMRDITDAVPAMIAYFEVDGRVRFHNRAFEEWFGSTREAMQGRRHEDLSAGAIDDEVRAKLDEVFAGYPVGYERREVNAAGAERDLHVTYFPRYGEDGDQARVIGYYVLANDITEFKRIDRMKSEFVSTVSHELRTPLTSIRGSLGLIAGGVAGPLPEAASNLIHIARNNCERLIRLINDILDTEKIESGRMRFELEVTELEPLLVQTLAANQGFANEHGVRFALHTPGGPVHADVDADRLTQVLTNLLSNAVKFSPTGSVVDISLLAMGSRVRIEVRDQGPGIPEEFRGRIFQKFSQADSSSTREKGGTGLGLNISKAIVERLGGTMGFTTVMGVGTVFHFDLPLSKSKAEEVAPVAGIERPRVLVCEDEPDIARLITLMLERAGYATDIARSATHARARLANDTYAAMTLDLRLPDEHGISLVRSLRRDPATARLPIVVISAASEEGRVQVNGERLSVSAWLDKPIDENRLVKSIRFAIEGVGEKWPRILHVEDDPDIRRVAATIAHDFALFEFAATLQEAREQLSRQVYDLVLLDLALPDGSGWDLVHGLASNPRAPKFVVFSATEVDPVDGRRVSAVLLKSQTSNALLVESLQRALGRDTLPIPQEA